MPRLIVVFLFVIASTGRADDSAAFDAMRWRLAGPFRGGRAVTAVGVPGEPDRFYFGAVGGGVWRTDNAGRTWEPVFDAQPIASIGAIAIAPSDKSVVYVGTGEADMRSDITYGDGVYRSTDGGRSFTHVGLEDTRQIGQIVVDPHDARRVFVAALGHAYGPNDQRGVFRSTDGGTTWSRVLFKDKDTGAIDLVLDPSDPKTMLAAMWQTRRPPWSVYPSSSGPGSGLYRSTDGGESWSEVTQGIPREKLGRIRLAFAPSDPRRVYAIVDAASGGLYLSVDHGASFALVNADRRIWDRGWYFAGVTVDPKDPDVVYACDTAMYRSADGGKTFLPFKGAPGGDDYHRLWIDPADSRRMITASDQGAVVTVDGGKMWSSWYNQPTGQFYHVATDDRFPYRIYGAQQDSGAAATPVRTDYRSITQRDWNEIAIGGESGYIAPDPDDADFVWGGTVGRFHWPTLQEQDVDPTLAEPGEYRGEWTLPLAIAPWPPHAAYFGRQFLFRSIDHGSHWERISPDLTRPDPGVPATLDPITAAGSDTKGPRRGVIYAIAPSPRKTGLIWCGTDDGAIWRTEDDGKHWSDVTPKDLAAWSKVGIIEASHFDAATAYAAIDRHRLDELTPIILRTRDGGKSWTRIASGIPEGSFVNVVREDPVRAGLLYAGTETGVFVSFDDGERWRPLQMNLPHCAIRDIDVRHGDLVVATHGRSFWVLDDVTPLRQSDAIAAAKDIVLLRPRDTVRLHAAGFQGSPEPKDEPMAENPAIGASIDYVVTRVDAPLSLEILDAAGRIVSRFGSDDPRASPPDLKRIRITPDWVAPAASLDASPGLHRFVWNLRASAPKPLIDAARGGTREVNGPWVPPGRYTVRLSSGARSLTQPLVIARDPRLPRAVTDEALSRQYALARDVEAERVRVASSLLEAASLRKGIAEARKQASGSLLDALDALSRTIDETAGPPSAGGEEFFGGAELPPTALRRLQASLGELQSAVESADAAPSRDAQAGLAARRKQVDVALTRWRSVVEVDVAKTNGLLAAAHLPPLR